MSVDVVAMYQQGASLTEVAASAGLSISGVVYRLDRAGVQRRPQGAGPRRHAAHTARRAALALTVVDEYLRGDSVLLLAALHGVSRTVIARILDDAVTGRRGRSEAMELRMAALTREQRQALTAAANTARREQGATRSELLARATIAEARGHLAALGEAELADLLRARGLNPVPQVAVGTHNIDLALEPVAVEVHRRTGHPLLDDRLVDRAAQLVAAGWSVLYVWCADGVRRGPGQVCFAEQCADEVAEHVTRARQGEVEPYRVLRCTGEDAHADTDRSAGTPAGRGANRPVRLDRY